MKPVPHNATPELRQLAEQLREKPTATEAALWTQLRKRRLQGLKFRFQHIALGYILDFYCPEVRLAIELDGPNHDPERDAKRDLLFAVWHVLVLRFPNSKPVDEMLCAIHAAVRSLQIRMIQQAAHATAMLRSMERGANWYANRRTQLQQQLIQVTRERRGQEQIELNMASSVKKIGKSAALTVKGMHVTTVRRKA